MGDVKKKCFVITPIGDNNSDIRRHIDGIIDQVIIPAIGDKYEVEVAHRKHEIGSINDRVIRSVYEADLVIANLTNLNPNVMFELAIRYSYGKPVIVIAEAETKLPFDIVDENTVFYVNDPAGASELKATIIEFENNIDYTKQTYGPVHRAISKVPLYKEVESGKSVSNTNMLRYIVERLNSLENILITQKDIKRNDIKRVKSLKVVLDFGQILTKAGIKDDIYTEVTSYDLKETEIVFIDNCLEFKFNDINNFDRVLKIKRDIGNFLLGKEINHKIMVQFE